MKPFVAETVAELKATVAKLNETISVLETVYGDVPEPPPVVAPVVLPPRGNIRGNGKPPKRQPMKAETAKIIDAVRDLKEPFAASAPQATCGLTYKTASNYLLRWKAKGWLLALGDGQYKRTPKFPAKLQDGMAMLKSIHEEINASKPNQED